MPSQLIAIFWRELNTASEDTWGYHLLEASEQGLNPDYSIADAAKGLRAGHNAAWPGKPCHGDVFHILHQGEGERKLFTPKSQRCNQPQGKTRSEDE